MKYVQNPATHRLTDSRDDVLFIQREEQLERTPYDAEKLFCSLLRSGDANILQDVGRFLKVGHGSGAPVGNLSSDNTRQAQYLFVAFLTIATRVAIESGLPEAEAYAFSDGAIFEMDRLRDAESVYQALGAAIDQIVRRIAAMKTRYSRVVNSAVSYISAHLHEPLTLPEIARGCAVSPSYLSRRFHAETGTTLNAYVLDEKLREAEMLLDVRNLSCAEAAAMLGFSSQSHFTSCFRQKYGVSPGRYKRACRASWW